MNKADTLNSHLNSITSGHNVIMITLDEKLTFYTGKHAGSFFMRDNVLYVRKGGNSRKLENAKIEMGHFS